MKYAIKVFTDGRRVLVEVPEDPSWKFFPNQIGADWMEIVRIPGHEDLVMVVDEEGLLKTSPTFNPIASWLYGTQEHGEPIVGDVLLLTEEMTDEGAELVGMEYDDMLKADEIITEHAPDIMELFREFKLSSRARGVKGR